MTRPPTAPGPHWLRLRPPLAYAQAANEAVERLIRGRERCCSAHERPSRTWVDLPLAAYTGLALLAGNLLRQHYMAPLVAKNSNIPGAAWVTSEWWTKTGTFAFSGRPRLGLLQQLCPSSFSTGPGGRIGISGSFSPTQCLLQHGYTQWADYQPASHFWPFQSIEGGWLLARAALLVAVTVWLVRRRVV